MISAIINWERIFYFSMQIIIFLLFQNEEYDKNFYKKEKKKQIKTRIIKRSENENIFQMKISKFLSFYIAVAYWASREIICV